MTTISATAEQEIKTLLVNWWTAVNAQLAAVTGATVQIGAAPVEVLFSSEIGQRFARLASIAEVIIAAEMRQEILPWAEAQAAQVLEDCDVVEAWLNQGPVFQKTPEDFWTTRVGYLVLRAKVWAHQDQLITLSAAAEISGMSLSVLSQRMTRGQLPGYRDPNVKNPKHGRRVRLSELHTLIDDNTKTVTFAKPAFLTAPTNSAPAFAVPRSS